MDVFFRCLLTRLTASAIVALELTGLMFLILAVVSAVVSGICLVTGIVTAGAGLAPCFAALLDGLIPLVLAMAIFVGAAAALMILNDIIQCAIDSARAAIGAAGAVGGVTPVGGDLANGAAPDCPTAQAWLARARANLAAALAARDAAAREARTADNRRRGAQAALAASLLALAASVFNPFMIPGAIVAAAAATALLARRTRQWVEATARLVAAEAALQLAIADLAAAEALVMALCPPATLPSGAGIIVGGRMPLPTVLPRVGL